ICTPVDLGDRLHLDLERRIGGVGDDRLQLGRFLRGQGLAAAYLDDDRIGLRLRYAALLETRRTQQRARRDIERQQLAVGTTQEVFAAAVDAGNDRPIVAAAARR